MNVGTLIDRAAKRYPDNVAAKFGQETISMRRFNYRSNQVGHALLSLGISKGERVAILETNSPRIHEAWVGALKIGGVIVNVNYRYSADEVLHLLNYTETKTIVFGAEFADLIDSIRSRLEFTKCYICLGDISGAHNYETLLSAASDSLPNVEVDECDLAGLHATGGTTSGRAKAAMMTHRNWLACIRNYTYNLHPEPASDKVLHTAPLTHLSGSLMFAYLAHGITNIILPSFDADTFLKTIEQEKITTTVLVPTLIYMLLDNPKIREHDLSSLRTIVYGASPISPSRLASALDIFGPVFVQGYGATETLGFVSVLPKEDHIAASRDGTKTKLSSAGFPVIDVDLKIVDEQGLRVPTGDVGEIAVRGDYMMQAYWNLPDETAEALKNGWYHTGDMGKLDEQGYLFIVDRKNNMIITGGLNVYPREVEDVLNAHPDIAESCVISTPDDRWGEAIRGVVVKREGAVLSADELIVFCKERLAGFKCPKSVDFVKELPKSAAGKVLHRHVSAQYWQGAKRQVS